MTHQHQILIIGQAGPLNPSDLKTYGSISNILSIVGADIQRAAAAGIACSITQINPHEPEEGLQDLEKRLTEDTKWDGVVVGWGIRGEKEFTDVFERVVELCRVAAVRMGFSTGVEGLGSALRRLVPGSGLDGGEVKS